MLFIKNVYSILKQKNARLKTVKSVSQKIKKVSLAFLSVGSNSNSFNNIKSAYNLINRNGATCLASPLYESVSVGDAIVILKKIPQFINCVFLVVTDKNQAELKNIINQVENDLNRKKSLNKYSEIPIDIDVILFDDKIIGRDNHLSSHCDIVAYDHILLPLCDLASNKIHPLYNKPMFEFIGKSKFKNVVKAFNVPYF